MRALRLCNGWHSDQRDECNVAQVWSTRADYEANKESLNTIRNSLEMVKQSAEDIKAAQYFQRGAINCTMGEC